MVASSLALLAASVGVVYSFQPADDGSGRYDYVVQVEPQLLKSLAAGVEMPIESQVPDHVSSIRTVRVVLGGDRNKAQADGRIERTSYKQVQNNWTASNTSSAAQTYGNYTTGGATTPLVQPPRVLGAVQEAGSALVDGTRAGVQEAGQRLQSAGQHMTSAVDDLSGGTLSRVGDAMRQPFNASPTGAGSTSQGPLQTVGAVARDFVDDTRQQFNSAGQAISDTAGRLVGSQDYRTQPTDYRSQTSAPSTMPANSGNVRYNNQSGADNTGLNDPGQNPFQAGASRAAVNGPSFGNEYRNQAASNQASDRTGQSSQSPFTTRGANTSQDGRYTNSSQQSDLVQVPSIDNWQYQERSPDYRNDNPFAAGQAADYTGMNRGNAGSFIGGQATITSDQANAAARDPWTNSLAVSDPQQGPGLTMTGHSNGVPGQQPGGVNFQQSGQNQQVGANDAPKERPWAPLLGTGVALIGSLGANLFLGFSFLDARHKYLSAIRRGARSSSRGDA